MKFIIYATIIRIFYVSAGSFYPKNLRSKPHLTASTKSYIIEKKLKIVKMRTYTKSSKKYLRFQKPTQLLIHGQWWSIFNTHLLQAEQ